MISSSEWANSFQVYQHGDAERTLRSSDRENLIIRSKWHMGISKGSISFIISMRGLVILYLCCQALLLALLYRKIPASKQYTQWQSILFYTSTILALITYFIAKFKSPGHLLCVRSEILPSIQDRRPAPYANEFEEIKRYCLACHHQQPYRTRHCTICRKCIRGFDHHCPLVQNCIGEKNRPHFFLFLICQNAQIIFSILLVEKSLYFKHIDYVVLTMFIVLLVFISVMGILLLFHLYLMFANKLTWQFFCSDSIHYIDNFQDRNPFDQGAFNNLALYWVFGCCRKDFYEWKIEKQQIQQTT